MRRHRNITISGRVQGVFFRTSAQEKAIELGVTGFARNEKNGDVYIEAEGVEEALRQFISWCVAGPRHAKVTTVNVETGPLQHFQEFMIRS